MSTSEQTHDHEVIKKWAEKRQGVPAKIKDTGKKENEGVLRIHFPDFSKSDDFEELDWDTFFKEFDDNKLDFLYQEKKEDGETSTFHKFIERE
ncbi:hypothetical protein [Pedobacter montanisoli]|uniref:1,4-alpha-glucan branching enzyme n=1 Tax=Pedobacter montanisoli TaxID=2923277 RepID=A0ABS9ZYM2_9SPHI|nr:hypothetical protein [Pedobacter montanisoli]MCJ0743401.1 hypothetical protein [Pedobacter montanisoli]